MQPNPDHADVQQRMRAVSLLFVGSMCGLLAFVFAGFLGIWKYKAEGLGVNYLGEPFPSGNNYYPQTVSMMVRDPMSPSGKCFSAFSTIGAICILMSWYPWQLRNVYVGDEAKIGGVSFLNLREFLPPVGMLLVSHIQVLPPAQRGFRDQVACAIHSLGAVMMIGGYCVFEIHALMSPRVHMRGRERCIRKVLIVLTLVCAVGFQALGLIVANTDYLGICCMDDWRVPQIADLSVELPYRSLDRDNAVRSMLANQYGKPMLYDTAHGLALRLKQAEYWFEVLAGIFMLASHLTIWWQCPERQLGVGGTLPNPGVYWDGDEDGDDVKPSADAAGPGYGAAA